MNPVIKVTGLQELERRLIALGEKAGIKVLRDSGRAALKPVLQDMIRNAGYDPENKGKHMRDSIKIRSQSGKRIKKGYRSGAVKLTVGPGKAHRLKAIAQEIGTIKQIPAPFIRPSLEYNRSKVIKTLKQELRDRLTR